MSSPKQYDLLIISSQWLRCLTQEHMQFPHASSVRYSLEAGEQLSFLSREATQEDAAHREVEQHLAGFD